MGTRSQLFSKSLRHDYVSSYPVIREFTLHGGGGAQFPTPFQLERQLMYSLPTMMHSLRHLYRLRSRLDARPRKTEAALPVIEAAIRVCWILNFNRIIETALLIITY